MASLLIATTRLQDIQPLAAAGHTPTEAWVVLSALLARELSPAHAALLAEPVEHAIRGETDWYVEGDGPAAPLDSLPPPAREAAEVLLAALIDDVARLAAARRAAAAPGERFLGELLAAATQVPDRAWVRVLTTRAGPQPVLVAWGHRRSGSAAAPVELTGRARRPPAPMTLLPPPSIPIRISATRRWLGPALAAGVLLPLLALLLLLADPLGWFVAPAPDCTVDQGQLDLLAQLRAGNDQEAMLRAQLAALDSAAGRRRLLCPPVRAASPGAAGDQLRARQSGAAGGRLQIILAWDDTNDLDLHVRCASDEIYFRRRTACGGTLDVDANATGTALTTSPVENVSFPDPAPGHYVVIVAAFAMRVAPASHYRVTVLQEGKPPSVVEGDTMPGQEMQTVTEVDVPAP